MVDKSDKCWWCKVHKATTSEHKYKQTDFKKLFSNLDLDDVVVNLKDSTKVAQGPNSKYLKWQKNLCAECNNSQSKQMDIAYSKFFNYTVDHFESIVQSRILNFRDVFESDWLKNKRLVYQYLVKHVCCRLHSNRASIPNSYIEFLNGDSDLKEIAFRLTFCEPALTYARLGESFLGVSPLNMNIMEDMKINYAISSYNFSAFKLQYLCSEGFHEGQHYRYNDYLNHSSIMVYEEIDWLSTRNDMCRHEYFEEELAYLEKNHLGINQSS